MTFDLAAHLAKTKQTRAGHPFIGTGDHELTVLEFRQSKHPEDGVIYAVDFVIDTSTAADHTVGSIRSAVFKIERRPEFSSQDSDADRLVGLVWKLAGATDLEDAQATAAKILSAEGLAKGLGRGMRIRAHGAPPRKTTRGKDFVNVTYSPVTQTREQVAARRAELDASHPRAAAARATPPPAPAPQPAATATPPPGGNLLDGI